MKVGSLFSGYGGLDLAVEAVFPDARTTWVADIDKGACKVLAHRFPDAPNLGDVTAIDWTTVEPVDVITGGSPCQDLSHAGKRAGMTEGTRSNLWVTMREAIAILRPSLVVWENVAGAYSAEADSDLGSDPRLLADTRRRDGEPVLRALGRVLGDLASLGFDAEWVGLRAADVGAAHGRHRVFVVAWPAADAKEAGQRDRGRLLLGGSPPNLDAGVGHSATTLLPTPVADNSRGLPSATTDFQSLANAVCSLLPTPAVNDMGAAYTPETWDAWTARMKAEHGNGNGHGASLNVEVQRLLPPGVAKFNAWGKYAAAITRQEAMFGRPAPEPTEVGPKGNPRLSCRFDEWLMGLPAGWITDVPDITHNETLRLCGNGVVWQQAAAALRVMLARALGSEAVA